MKKLIDKVIAKLLALPLKQQYLLGFAIVVAVLAAIKPFVHPAEEGSDMVEQVTPLTSSFSPLNSKKHHRILSVPNYKALVYVGESPYYHVDKLNSSIPYLVPRAALLLQDIGQAFYDSLYMKGVPLNQLIVTSVLRTKEDVARLQRHNGNATDNSCHLYGTTFDICYNRYHALDQEVRNDTLKWVLSEVLRDIRKQDRAFIKYEVKQGCFHMTVR